jgi:Spy/CpxP family protein refolding chaperone
MPRFPSLFILASAAAFSALALGWFAGTTLAQESGAAAASW